MNKIIVATVALALPVSLLAQTTTKPKPKAPVKTTKPMSVKPVPAVTLRNLADSASYALGVNVASSLKMQSMDKINTRIMEQAMKDVFANKTPLIDDNSSFTILNAYSSQMQEAKSKSVIDSGTAFLARNAKRPGVKTTASGLQYEVITPGTGIKPLAADTVTAHYSGILTDGQEFDGSRLHGSEPISFPLNRVIPGWTEGLQLMPVGSKYRLYIPYNLGYGLHGSPPKIPGGATLIFDIELIDVKKANGGGN
jgi:FKBP-type peptidyl-prolyl cis-trans isomerase